MSGRMLKRAWFALFLLAAAAPFLAHEAPILVGQKGRLESPLLTTFDAEDVLWSGGGLAVFLFVLASRWLPKRRDLKGALAVGLFISLLWLAGSREPVNTAVRDFDRIEAAGAFVLRTPCPWGWRKEDPAEDAVRLPPFRRGDHLLGTDGLGRDLASRLIHGARTSLSVGMLTTLLATLIGIAMGSLAAWKGGLWDRGLSFVILVVSCFPLVVLLLALQGILPGGVLWMAGLLAAVRWVVPARLVRHEILRLKEEAFILAARTLGLSSWRILWHHLLPHARGSLIVSAAFGVGVAVSLEAGLSFLGFGVSGERPSWGRMLADGRGFFQEAPHLVLVPGIALLVLILMSHALAEQLRQDDAAPPGDLQG